MLSTEIRQRSKSVLTGAADRLYDGCGKSPVMNSKTTPVVENRSRRETTFNGLNGCARTFATQSPLMRIRDEPVQWRDARNNGRETVTVAQRRRTRDERGRRRIGASEPIVCCG